MGLIEAGASGILDIAGQMIGNNTNMENQMILNQQAQDIQQQNWDYTNYENQRKHMENAGLNVGLMYGMSGGGGSTMGSGSGSQAPQIDLGRTGSNTMAMMLQSEAIQSQVKANEAAANKSQAEADEINKWKKDNVIADTGVKLSTAEGIKLDNAYKSGNMKTALETSKQMLEKTKAENFKLIQEGKKSEIEAKYEEKNQTMELISKGIENLLNKQKTEESKQHVKQVYDMIEIERKNASTNSRNASTNSREADAKTQEALTNSLRQLKESLPGSANEENRNFIDSMVKLLGMGTIGLGQASKPTYIMSNRGHR